MTVNQFKGFVVIGRIGQSKTYEELLAELGSARQGQDRRHRANQAAKTFPVYLANYQPLITAVLGQAGLTIDDIQTINFADDEKAALAFISGEGDFYIGGLPSEINLLMNHSDQFQLIGGAEIPGSGRPHGTATSHRRRTGWRRMRTPHSRSWRCRTAIIGMSRKTSARSCPSSSRR